MALDLINNENIPTGITNSNRQDAKDVVVVISDGKSVAKIYWIQK